MRAEVGKSELTPVNGPFDQLCNVVVRMRMCLIMMRWMMILMIIGMMMMGLVVIVIIKSIMVVMVRMVVDDVRIVLYFGIVHVLKDNWMMLVSTYKWVDRDWSMKKVFTQKWNNFPLDTYRGLKSEANL